MELKDMTSEQLEERRQAIAAELDAPEADLEALENEARAIREELDARKAAEEAQEAEQRAAELQAQKEARDAVAHGAGEELQKFEGDKKMTNAEVRSTNEYIEAYANYVKTGKDTECRALLTETVSGTVPVPTFVEGYVNTAWEKNGILSRVKRTFLRGNLKVAFERSATGAYVHTEGTSADTEETLTLGIVTLIPRNIKKYLHISDEAAAMGGAEFLRYIYDEITYQIALKLAALVVGDIAGASTSHSGTAVGIPQVAAAPAIGTVASAFSNLSDEAENPVVIMNKLTYQNFYDAYAQGNFAVDPFMGFTVLYSSALPAYDDASEDDVYCIVGDLRGAQVNFPEGDDVIMKYDDLSEAEADLVKIVGREYAAHGVTAPGRFCNIVVPAAATTE